MTSIHPDRARGWIRRSVPLLRAYRAGFALALVGSLVSLLVSLQVPALLQRAVDRSLVDRDSPLDRYVLTLVLLALATAATSYAARQQLMRVSHRLEYDLRNLVYAQLVHQPAAFHDRHQTGDLLSRASADVRAVQLFLAFGPFIAVQLLGAVVAFGFMVSIDVPLALITIATVPLVAATTTRLQRALWPTSALIQARLAEVSTVVDESISGKRVVTAFAAEDRQLRALTRASRRLRWAYVTDADTRARIAPLAQNLPQLGMVAVLLVGGRRVAAGDLQVGAILAFAGYVALLQGPFQMVGHIVALGQRAGASARRIFELLDERPALTEAPDAVTLTVPHGEVRFTDVTFGYTPEQPVLRDFSLTLRRGETVALVGRTGSGKSTVARLLQRSYDVSAGSVTIDGVDVRAVTLGSLRAAVGVAMEEPFLFSTTVHDNIAYADPAAPRERVAAAARTAGADEVVAALPAGYDTVLGERGATLSGGQRQRLALARSLVVDHPVLVLDDATSSLDVEVEAAVLGRLADRLRDRTVLVVAHRLATIRTADRVVLLDGGRVVADGTHEQLLAGSADYREVLAHVHAHESHEDDRELPDSSRAAGPAWPGADVAVGLQP